MRETRATTVPDPMAKWTPVPDWSVTAIASADLVVTPVTGLSITLVAGNIAAAVATLVPGFSEVGLWQVPGSSNHIIRIARDRALIVTDRSTSFEAGWNEGGFSLTDASSAHGVIDICGPALPDVIAEATAADTGTGSRSACILFAGIPCLVVRSRPDVARVYIEAAYMTYLWRWLETRA